MGGDDWSKDGALWDTSGELAGVRHIASAITVTYKIILQLAVVMNITKVGTTSFQQQLHSKSCFTL